MSRASEDALGELHSLVATELSKRILSGDATPAEISNAIRFLKDNGIEAVAEPDGALGRMVAALPDFAAPNEEGLPN